MAGFNLDRIKYNWRGIWNPNVSFAKDDMVYYQGKVYACLTAHQSSENFYYDQNPESTDNVFVVSVGADTFDSQRQGHFYIDFIENPVLTLLKGRKYIFRQDDASNITYNTTPSILLLSTVENGILSGGAIWQNGVQYFIDNLEVTFDDYIENFEDAITREMHITVPSTAPASLHYFSYNQIDLGAKINTKYDSYWDLVFDGQTWKGDWQPDTLYSIGNIVKYRGRLFICIESHTSPDATAGIYDIDTLVNWNEYAKAYYYAGSWNATTPFYRGDVVIYSGNVYNCIQNHTSGNFLEDNKDNWILLSAADKWAEAWIGNSRYTKNDIVKHGGNVFRAVTSHISDTDDFSLDAGYWEIVISGIDYLGNWQTSTRYELNNLVKYGASVYRCILAHVSDTESFTVSTDSWEIWLPGLEFENYWNEETVYNIGDIVIYGGYSYTCIKNNTGSQPDKLQDWELLISGYTFTGDYDPQKLYKTGEVIRYSGNLYIARLDATIDENPQIAVDYWQLIVPGRKFRQEWNDDTLYYKGDIILYRGTAYVCILEHQSTSSDSRPDLDKDLISLDYWEILIQGAANNILSAEGDLQTFDTNLERIPIGNVGAVLTTQNNFPTWKEYETVPEVYYVAMDGIDRTEGGRTVDGAWKTISFAVAYIQLNWDANKNYTIFVKSGVYQEILPISIPANCAIVGDELRSTSIQPAPGYELENMFFVRDGSGLRNLSLQGLSGELGELTQYLTRRPTAGAYVSLDPGGGPDDESVWIKGRSPYIQNVSTFGTGCIGMKIDGALHNGGNDSIVANDFTQILSDGIGYWADNLGRSELVSVFTYYCHIGYLATNGGILRATNGNNSYGTFGSVAEGFDVNEVPVTATVNNIDNHAVFGEGVTYGTVEQLIIAISYLHAGQDYSLANITFGGSGINALARYDEFRNGAISDVRVLGPADSSVPGGRNYTYSPNFAQSGTTTTITLSNAEDLTIEQIVGQRVTILSGLGVGQYAEISEYDDALRIASVIRETDGQPGWNHYQPGWPIENLLNDTTRYVIEPKVIVEDPPYSFFAVTPPIGFDWEFVTHMNNVWVACTNGSTTPISSAYSVNGQNWQLVSEFTSGIVGNITTTGEQFILCLYSDELDNPTNKIYTTPSGQNWTESTLPITDRWTDITSDGDGNVFLLGENGNILISADHGNNWTQQTIATSNGQSWSLIQYAHNAIVIADNGSIGDVAYSLDNGTTWINIGNIGITSVSDIAYGNNRFVMVNDGGDSAISFNGIDWQVNSGLQSGTFAYVSYGNGIFIATGDQGLLARSADGLLWYTSDSNGNFSLGQNSSWKRAAFANDFFVIVNSNANLWVNITIGTVPILRASLSGNQLQGIFLYDVGAGYSTTPTITIIDNQVTVEAEIKVNIADGVLGQATILNRGTGYVTLTGQITGNGYAELYQTGRKLKVSNLTRIPGPGANIKIDTITYAEYNLSSIEILNNNAPYEAILTLVPSIQSFESPPHGTQLVLRERYSQIRLTGHDFLDIGTGNFIGTDYPDLYLFGETTLNARQPFNETVNSGGGRVFYTSTDQDGNFRVGDLFKVEQASGVVTISATQFELGGLTELSLGGIQIGASTVVIREFSKDPTFVADSNNIVPTQRAIKAYVDARVSGGGSNATTNKLVASQVAIEQNIITTVDNSTLQIEVASTIIQGIDGHFLASQTFF